ncbi:MAG: hypothetical protein LBG24_01375 [Treponema sp.]|jgi:hypothetical protein|nr:hypothetical protein [Treponema sp.]
MSKILLKAEDLDGYLTESDKGYISRMNGLYKRDAAVSGSDYVYILSKWTLDRLFKSADSFK